jgi:hypothetical protein
MLYQLSYFGTHSNNVKLRSFILEPTQESAQLTSVFLIAMLKKASVAPARARNLEDSIMLRFSIPSQAKLIAC